MEPQKIEEYKYFVYTRKSSEDEEKQVLSINSQKERIETQFGKIQIVEVLEETKSAFKPYDRPVFTSMMERIKKGEAQGAIAWHPDRLSRNEIDAATVTYMIRTGQLKDLKFCSYNFDNSPEGIWMLQMALSQSQYFSAKLGKDVKRGMEQKVKMGWQPGVAPEGYMNDKDGEKGDKIIRIDPVRFPLVRKMWDLMLTGNYSVPQIHKIVNEDWGYKTIKRRKSGGCPISKSGLYEMFTKLFYTGSFEYNGTIHPGKHEAMITLEEFDRVQMLLGRKGKPKPKTHEFAYTGAMRCGECGCLITAEEKLKYQKKTGETKKHTYYHCTKKKKELQCSQKKALTIDNLELQIEKELEKCTIKPQFLEWAIEYLNESNDNEIDTRSNVYEMQHQSLTKAQKELDELTRMRYRGFIDDDTFLKEKKTLQLEINKHTESLRDTEKRAENWLELTEKTFYFATYARSKFMKASLQEKRELLLGLGQNIIIQDEKLSLDTSIWFERVANEYPKLEAEYTKVRTVNYTDIKAKTEALTSVHTHWLQVVDDVRTILQKSEGVSIPNLSTVL